jgi:glyoxylase-like metal-dependent hydrolase (beta-lactamase superfamily II)
MADFSRTLQLGDMAVTIINVGDFLAPYAEWSNVSLAELSAQDTADLTKPIRMPVQCFHIALPGLSVLVDASKMELPQDHPDAIPGYQMPPGLFAGLAEAKVEPDRVTHVIITHGHGDHFNAATREEQGEYVPCFPNARHYFGRADWDQMQSALQDLNSVESRTLGVLQSKGLLDLVDGDWQLGAGLHIIAAPGETPGHQIVRFHLGEHTLYFLGDLYHHVVEVEHPTWMVNWNDVDANVHSRQALTKRALPERALLFATHIPGAGRVRQSPTGLRWEAAA